MLYFAQQAIHGERFRQERETFVTDKPLDQIGIVKFAQRLSSREEFEVLRDFGFGTARTLPSESFTSRAPHASPSWLRGP